MPLLPTYTPFWGAQPWENLPRTETPIIAASLKHIDDALAAHRNRIEEVAEALIGSDAGQVGLIATKADKATKVTAGTGLSGGGDLSESRTFAVKYGTTAGTATEGNDQRIADSVKTPTGVTIVAGDLLIGQTDGRVKRLPRTQPGLILGSGATEPGWVTPESSGVGLPAATMPGQIAISRADGTWTLTAHGPTGPGQVATTDANGVVRWAKGDKFYAVVLASLLSPTITGGLNKTLTLKMSAAGGGEASVDSAMQTVRAENPGNLKYEAPSGETDNIPANTVIGTMPVPLRPTTVQETVLSGITTRVFPDGRITLTNPTYTYSHNLPNLITYSLI